jgi:phenylalanyl-tRNA synthetase beta chain
MKKKRELNDRDLMICDADHGMCIAGVFGGIDSGVSENTTEIFLESAYFNPVWVRKTAKRHGLNTDASFRFERGIDPELTVYALKRAALLIKKIAGASITSEVVDIYPKKFKPFKVKFNKQHCDSLIGKNIDSKTVKFILDTLDIKVLSEKGDDWVLEVPQYRADVTREADVIEEILRIYGFNNIEIPEKIHASLSYSPSVDPEKIIRSTSDFLASRGFNEMMANSLITDRYVSENENNALNTKEQVCIVNPLSSDLNVLRQTLLFNGLEAVAYNQNRQHPDLMLFEFGNVYRMLNDYSENFRLAIYLSGKTQPNNWNKPASDFTFFDLKGEVNALLKKLGLYNRIATTDTQWEVFEEGIDLNIKNKTLVHLGIVDRELVAQFDIKGQVFYADFNWDYLFSLLKAGSIKIADLPKFPAVRRDLSLLLDKGITFKSIRDLAFKAERKLLKSVELFDVYEGKGMEPGKKSYAISFVLQDATKTLNDKTIDKAMRRIQQVLERELGAKLRG